MQGLFRNRQGKYWQQRSQVRSDQVGEELEAYPGQIGQPWREPCRKGPRFISPQTPLGRRVRDAEQTKKGVYIC